MTRDDLVNEWLDLADQDRRSADFLGAMIPVPAEVICFHYQQAAEKALKALLEFHAVEIPRSHDLLVLWSNVTRVAETLPDLERECNLLNDYSVSVRYPARIELTEEDVDAAKRAATTILSTIQQWLKTTLH